VSGNVVTPVGAGSCTVHSTQAGNANWNAAVPVDQPFTVTAPTVANFLVSAPASSTAMAPFNVTVTARDSGSSTVTSYTGTVHFTSTAGSASLPADYKFVAGDLGVHTFTNVRLNTAGSWTVTATDTVLSGVAGTSGSVSVAAAGAAALTGVVTAKSGASNLRVWTFTVTDGGPGAAYLARIDSMSLTQTAGAPCSPVVATSFPLPVGDIAAAASAGGAVSIDFTGCVVTARFRATFAFSANLGAATGTRTLYNQFQ
jgi:hypothetical protein